MRGLNKATRHSEIGSHLKRLNCVYVALLETRVNQANAGRIRQKLGRWHSTDNYSHHVNGRIWILWDPRSVEYRVISSSAQHVHGSLYRLDGTLVCWLTFVRAFNQLELRKTLWTELHQLSQGIKGAWCILGDFNNVTSVQDRIGGNNVSVHEIHDL